MSIRDELGRPLRDLRISVTDRCNLRCIYCMPKEVFGTNYRFLPRRELLTYEEIARLAKLFVSLGVRKIRITGGEPLLRQELPELIGGLAEIEGLRDLTLTTNGLLLARQAKALKAAGLKRVTVSLDSVEEEIFAEMSGLGARVKSVLVGVQEAADAGLRPVKVNCVIRRGVNDHLVVDLARFFRGSGHILRFIEYMDVGNTNRWRLEEVVPAQEIIERIHAQIPLEPLPSNYPGEVARRWRYADGDGEIGVISSVTRPFCAECRRLRLSPEGQLFTCLFAAEGFDLRGMLRRGAADGELISAIRDLWARRTDRYSETRRANTTRWPKVEMSRIGG